MAGPITVEKVLYYLVYIPGKTVDVEGNWDAGDSYETRKFERRIPGYFYIASRRFPWSGARTWQLLANPEQFGLPLQRANHQELTKFLLGMPPYQVRFITASLKPDDIMTDSERQEWMKTYISQRLQSGRYIARTLRKKPAAGQSPRAGHQFKKSTVAKVIFTRYNPLLTGRTAPRYRTPPDLGLTLSKSFVDRENGNRFDPKRAIPLGIWYRIQLHDKPIPGLSSAPQIASRTGRTIARSADPEGRHLNQTGEERWVALGAKILQSNQDWRASHPEARGVAQRRVTYIPGQGIRPMAPSRDYSVRVLPMMVHASSEAIAVRRMEVKLQKQVKSKDRRVRARARRIERMWKAAEKKVLPRRKWDEFSRSYRKRKSDFVMEEALYRPPWGLPKRFSALRYSPRVY